MICKHVHCRWFTCVLFMIMSVRYENNLILVHEHVHVLAMYLYIFLSYRIVQSLTMIIEVSLVFMGYNFFHGFSG